MKICSVAIAVFWFTELHTNALAKVVITHLGASILKIDKTLYRTASVNQHTDNIIIDLGLYKERDGYSADSMKICFREASCEIATRRCSMR